MTKAKQQLELKATLARAGMRHRDLASAMRERGHRFEEYDVTRIISGRWEPPRDVRQEISAILGKATFELFQ